MQGYTARIYSSYTRGRGNNNIFCRIFLEVFQEGCFSGARFAGEENVFGGFRYKAKCEIKNLVMFNSLHYNKDSA